MRSAWYEYKLNECTKHSSCRIDRRQKYVSGSGTDVCTAGNVSRVKKTMQMHKKYDLRKGRSRNRVLCCVCGGID